MYTLNTILLSNRKYPFRALSQKIFLDGKSYKISLKQKCGNMRFNRANRTILAGPYIRFKNKNEQKKLYLLNAGLSKCTLRTMLVRIRFANTYTLRGVWATNTPLPKRAGRISEYM